MNKRISNYNDGVLKLWERKDTSKNIKSPSDLIPIGTLNFTYMSLRQQDYEFAELNSNSIAVKVRTPDNGKSDVRYVASIGDMLYSIINIDRDHHRSVQYFYLEEIRKIEALT